VKNNLKQDDCYISDVDMNGRAKACNFLDLNDSGMDLDDIKIGECNACDSRDIQQDGCDKDCTVVTNRDEIMGNDFFDLIKLYCVSSH